MPLWGSNTSAQSNAPKFRPLSSHKANTVASNTLFGNTTPGAFVNGAIKTVAGANQTGWYLRTRGTGPVVSAVPNAGGSGYANTDVVNFASQSNSLNGGVNASATVSTNSTGGIVSLVLVNPGAGFINNTPTAAVANSTGGASAGTSATFTVVVGGRAGRQTDEILVAAGSFTG